MCDIGQKNAREDTLGSFPLADAIGKGNRQMELDDWKRVVDDIVESNWKPLLLLTGTEPFIYPEVLALIEYILKKNIPLHITTNGSLLSSYAHRLVDMAEKPGSLSLTLSLDGIGEIHDTIRGVRGTFDKAIKGLEEITSRKRIIKRQG